MLAALVQTGRKAQYFVRCIAGCGNCGVESGLTFGQSSCLVHYQRVHLAHFLDGASIAEQHPLCRGTPCGHHHRHRRGQPQRTGASDDQHGHCVNQAKHPARFRTEPTPDKEGGNGDEHHHDHKFACHHIRHALHGRLRALGIGHHLNNLRQHGGRTDFFGAHHQGATGVHRGANHIVTKPFGHRHRLASKHGFIDRTAAFGHNAVDRHFLAGTNAQQIPDVNMVQRHVLFAAIRIDAASGLGCQTEQRLDRRRSLRTGLQLDDLAQHGQRDDDHCRLIVNSHATHGNE